MVAFISYRQEFFDLLRLIILQKQWHIKWLNTLSYLENCGARKIAACEHPTKVKREMLKHAAEEFRHAFYLKQQISKITDNGPVDYSYQNILGGVCTFHYLPALDLKICRYLKEQDLTSHKLKEVAYLLVTYAIEKRASEVYPAYQQLLKELGSPITVKSILLEEDQHLTDMETELALVPNSQSHIVKVCEFEGSLCKLWLKSCLRACLQTSIG